MCANGKNILIVKTSKKEHLGPLLTSFRETSCIDKISLSLSIGWTSSVVRASPPNSNLPGIEFQSIPTGALFYFLFFFPATKCCQIAYRIYFMYINCGKCAQMGKTF